MTAEVAYLLDRLEHVENAQPEDHPLERINRDESLNVTRGERKKAAELRRANFVSVSFGSDNPSIRGHEYHLDNVVTCEIRVVGLHWTEHGHVDPAGEKGVPWRDTYENGDVDQQGLINQIKNRIYDDRTYPDVPGPDAYRNILPIVESDLSSDHRDDYRTVLTVPFRKVESP